MTRSARFRLSPSSCCRPLPPRLFPAAESAGRSAAQIHRGFPGVTVPAVIPEEKRTAQFVSAVCCVFPNGDMVTARGECPGHIAFAPAGEGGFGYDPLFLVKGGKTYAELSAEEKDALSHRGNALRLFRERLAAYLNEKDGEINADK